jgi:hypothetical protein
MLALALLLAAPAHADRPTDGTGLFSFESTDEIAFVDGPAGVVRVHYSVSGPNQTILYDTDGSGAPDFPELVAATAEDVLVTYEALGFRAPLSEADVGLADLGGSGAFDFYLVDFGGNSDGNFAIDRCSGSRCAGHMIMENDFHGYGYPSIAEATAVLTSHELFHAVQAAYNASQPVWMSEGTAVWAEWAYDPTVRDFDYFASAYLEDTGRSLDRPPAGVTTAFAYGTALFFAFLDEYYSRDTAIALQEEMDGRAEEEAVDAIVAVITAEGGTLAEAWTTFVRWNLATGDRAGATPSYTFADDLHGVTLEQEAEGTLSDDNRFYPLAATYFGWAHDGGAAQLVAVDDPTGLVFSLHPVNAGQVGDPVASWAPTAPGAEPLGDLDAGDYVLVGTYPEVADQSVKVAFCLGPVADCAVEEDGGDDGGSGGDGSDGGDAGDGGDDDKGGCSTLPGPASGLLALLALPLWARRRR